MSTLRNQVALVNVWNDLVDAWGEQASEADDTAPNTGVFARRSARDSYTHERPLISARLDLHAEDLIDIGTSCDDEGVLDIHLRRTLRP